MASRGTSILATTHYMDEAEYCNTVGMMYAGELVALASPDDLRTRLPGHLVQIDCDLPGRAVRALASAQGVLETSIHGAQLHVLLAGAEASPYMLEQLTRAGVIVRSSRSIQPSLEDIFLYIVERRLPSAAGASGE